MEGVEPSLPGLLVVVRVWIHVRRFQPAVAAPAWSRSPDTSAETAFSGVRVARRRAGAQTCRAQRSVRGESNPPLCRV